MSVGCAAGLLSSGAFGDEYGRRRAFLVGAVVLAAGSLLGAAAPDAVVLVLARIPSRRLRRRSPATST
jgi:MFS family permease